MSRLGIERHTGLVFEGRDDPSFPSWPTPMISHATLIDAPSALDKLPHNLERSPFGWMFREDSFDPVSRVRRGRLYQKFGNQDFESMMVQPHPALAIAAANRVAYDGRVTKDIGVFIECTDLLSQPNNGTGMLLAIGAADAYSLWQILQVERSVNLDVMVTLRARSAMGVLPEIAWEKIQPSNRGLVRSAITRVIDAAYKELPTSVVDQCRNAATVLVSRWMHQVANDATPIEKDLGAWISTIHKRFAEKPRVALCSALEIINKLHPRGKDNELMRIGLRAVTEGDADFAIHAIGFVIRELDWAAN